MAGPEEAMSTMAKFRSALRPLLHEIGFRQRRDHFARELSPDVFAQIDTHFLRDRSEAVVSVDVAVGVQHLAVERLAYQLKGRPVPDDQLPSTVGSQIGYLMPRMEHVSYFLDDTSNTLSVARDVARDLSRYAPGFIDAHASLTSVAAALSGSGRGLPAASAAYRLPVALYLLGKKEAALAAHHNFRDTLAQGANLWALEYRRFGDAFTRLLDET